MVELAHSIDLNLSEKLQNAEYRKRYFLAEASARIAAQIIALRKKRGLSQKELAVRIGTGQPAISRAERADYQNWSFNTLRSIAEQLDARVRVIIEPAEEILPEYNSQRGLDNVSDFPSATSGTIESVGVLDSNASPGRNPRSLVPGIDVSLLPA